MFCVNKLVHETHLPVKIEGVCACCIESNSQTVSKMDVSLADALQRKEVPEELSKYLRDSLRKWFEMRVKQEQEQEPKEGDEDEDEEEKEEEEEEDPDHVIDFGRRFESSLSSPLRFVNDPEVADTVTSVWKDLDDELVAAQKVDEQNEFNASMAFMLPDVVRSIVEDERTSDESRRAALFVLRVARPYLVSCAKELSKEDEGEESAGFPINDCEDDFELRLLEMVDARWKALKSEVESSAWQVALDGASDFPVDLRTTASTQLFLGEGERSDATKFLGSVVRDRFDDLLQKISGRVSCYISDVAAYESQLCLAARSSMFSDDQVTAIAEEVTTMTSMKYLGSSRRGREYFARSERFKELRDACDEDTRPRSHAATRDLCRKWTALLRRDMYFGSRLDDDDAHGALACLYESKFNGATDLWTRCLEQIRDNIADNSTAPSRFNSYYPSDFKGLLRKLHALSGRAESIDPVAWKELTDLWDGAFERYDKKKMNKQRQMHGEDTSGNASSSKKQKRR